MRSQYSITLMVFVLLALLLGSSVAFGQTKQLLNYRASLDAIQKLPAGELEEGRDTIAQIRTGVEFWLRLHPNTTLKLEAAPQQPWNSDQILKEAKLLSEIVDGIIKEDRVQSFELGSTEVSVTAELSPISPITDSIDRTEISNLRATNVADSVLYLPGVALDYKSGRNQTGIMIRGFDTRQIGVYLDGVPVYVPYDGYADLGRFLTNDLAVVELAKGYSSPLLGPNGLGGTINLVSRQPEKKFEGDLSIGTGSGRMLQSGAHFGSKWDKFLIRGGMDWLETDYFPLSGNFTPNSSQPTFNRVNSDKRDVQYNGRLGYTPSDQDQYIFTYMKQKAENNVPSYAGIDPVNNQVRHWMYPYWNRDSYYFNSNSGIGESSAIQFRAFYDQYPNGVTQFANQAHSSMQWFTAYDDYSAGFSSEFLTKSISRHSLGGSFFFKDDTHKSQDTNVDKKTGRISIEPWTLVRDRLVSLGFQDVMSLSAKFRATVGISMDYLNGVEAQDLDATNTIIPFQCTKGTVTGPCVLPSEWALNPLASLSYSVADSGTLFFTFALKSHFPTLKDRYSSKMGKAVPSPDLKPERARNYSLGYSHAFAFNTTMQLELFRSDVYDAIAKTYIPEENPDQCTGTKCEKSINVAEEVHEGFEFTVRSSPFRRLNLTANYTFLQRTIDGPADFPTFPTGTPKHRTVATASIQLPRQFLVLASARYESGTFTTNYANAIVPSSNFATMDLGGILPIYAGASLQVGVKNLFDRNYYYQEGYPEAGRNWYVNLRYRF